MVLSSLADLIYNFFSFCYYLLKTSAYIGYLLLHFVRHLSLVLHWCMKNIHSFLELVFDDNRYYIQNVTSFFYGIADFFVNNISTAYTAICFTIQAIINAVTTFFKLPVLIFDTAKQCLVHIGESVWFLCTLPLELALQLRDLTILFATALKDDIQDGCLRFNNFLLGCIHYTINDVPFEAACGLALLALLYCFPTPRNAALKLLATASRSIGRALRSLLRKCIRLVVRIYVTIVVMTFDLFRRLLQLLGIVRLQHLVTLRAYIASIYDREICPMLATIHRTTTNDRPGEDRAARPVQRQKTPHRTTLGLCIICEDHERSVAFVPCGHICTCKECTQVLCYHNPVCPLCRSYIQQRLEVYT